MEKFGIIAPPLSPTSHAIFPFFYPFTVKLKCSVIQQNWSVTIILSSDAEDTDIEN